MKIRIRIPCETKKSREEIRTSAENCWRDGYLRFTVEAATEDEALEKVHLALLAYWNEEGDR